MFWFGMMFASSWVPITVFVAAIVLTQAKLAATRRFLSSKTSWSLHLLDRPSSGIFGATAIPRNTFSCSILEKPMYFFLKIQSHLKSIKLLGAFVALHSCRARRMWLSWTPTSKTGMKLFRSLKPPPAIPWWGELWQEPEPSPTPSSRIPIENDDEDDDIMPPLEPAASQPESEPSSEKSVPTAIDENPFQPDLEWKVLWNTGVFIEGNGWQEWHQRDVRFANGVRCFQAPSHPQDPSFDSYTSPFDLRCVMFFPDTILCLSWDGPPHFSPACPLKF